MERPGVVVSRASLGWPRRSTARIGCIPEAKREAALSEMTKDLKGRDPVVLNILVAELVRRNR